MDLLTDQVIFFKSLLNCSVLDTKTGKVLGQIEQIWLGKDQHKVLGFTFRSWYWSETILSLTWEDVKAIDKSGVWVTASEKSQLIFQSALCVDNQCCDQIWNCPETKKGQLVGYRFNAKTGKVLDYLWLDDEDGNSFYVLHKILPTAFQEERMWLMPQDDRERTITKPSTSHYWASLIPRKKRILVF